ncbi:hypothetical protein GCM10011380_32830 [Sphingomonas metalli]|uniref:Uncharacterized protein n=1 Tax=Sphingomonas metalli TaxID=1779358 RepID=A0A916WZ37_9SPHN|nr:hypothetical protein [Sphingomonas metalli]GGB40803.1 hypothetical protein GCM10011380_32830 [Sphingomonas metalli]
MTSRSSWADAFAAIEAFGSDAFDFVARLIFAEAQDAGSERYAYLCTVALNIGELQRPNALN